MIMPLLLARRVGWINRHQKVAPRTTQSLRGAIPAILRIAFSLPIHEDFCLYNLLYMPI